MQQWPLSLSGSHFVYTRYVVLHLSFQKSEQVPVTKFPNCTIVEPELHGRVASHAGSAKKRVALRQMPVTLQF